LIITEKLVLPATAEESFQATALDNSESIPTSKHLSTPHIETNDIRVFCVFTSGLAGEVFLIVNETLVLFLESLMLVADLGDTRI
jgi:hypothetical protein